MIFLVPKLRLGNEVTSLRGDHAFLDAPRRTMVHISPNFYLDKNHTYYMEIYFSFPRAGVGTHSRRASVEVKR